MRRDRNLKAQLGVRVPAEVRQAALEAAERDGVSLNVWVENLIRERITIPHPQIEGQIEIKEAISEHLGGFAATQPEGGKGFDPECRNKSYHWKHGPGRPCRFCGGET